MSINLIIRPDVPSWTKEEFIGQTPSHSIALDGIVRGPSWWNMKSKHANFNHHEDCHRQSTRATCEQVYLAILQGFFQSFRNGSGIQLNIYVNDCDEDVATAVFLLRHRKLIGKEENGRLRRLVETEGKIDATGGCYRLSTRAKIWGEIAWVYEPYRRFRLRGELFQRDPQAYRKVIDQVGERIMANINGRGERIELTKELLAYDRIGGGTGWQMIVEKGEYGRLGALNDGIEAFVSVRERGDGTWAYTYGKISEWIPFDILGLLDHLNQIDNLTDNPDRHGGADTVGGSPRIAGSRRPPEEMQQIINQFLAK
jgi:hypothetical protein